MMDVNIFLIGLVVMLFCWVVYFKIEDRKGSKKDVDSKQHNE